MSGAAVFGIRDAADELLALEDDVRRLLAAEHRMRREREEKREQASRLRLKLTREQAARYEALR